MYVVTIDLPFIHFKKHLSNESIPHMYWAFRFFSVAVKMVVLYLKVWFAASKYISKKMEIKELSKLL